MSERLSSSTSSPAAWSPSLLEIHAPSLPPLPFKTPKEVEEPLFSPFNPLQIQSIATYAFLGAASLQKYVSHLVVFRHPEITKRSHKDVRDLTAFLLNDSTLSHVWWCYAHNHSLQPPPPYTPRKNYSTPPFNHSQRDWADHFRAHVGWVDADPVNGPRQKELTDWLGQLFDTTVFLDWSPPWLNRLRQKEELMMKLPDESETMLEELERLIEETKSREGEIAPKSTVKREEEAEASSMKSSSANRGKTFNSVSPKREADIDVLELSDDEDLVDVKREMETDSIQSIPPEPTPTIIRPADPSRNKKPLSHQQTRIPVPVKPVLEKGLNCHGEGVKQSINYERPISTSPIKVFHVSVQDIKRDNLKRSHRDTEEIFVTITDEEDSSAVESKSKLDQRATKQAEKEVKEVKVKKRKKREEREKTSLRLEKQESPQLQRGVSREFEEALNSVCADHSYAPFKVKGSKKERKE
ncbi:hypothetical protein T439DRAFT_356910 [Meredithblackwellia eburnea MCA 4105]